MLNDEINISSIFMNGEFFAQNFINFMFKSNLKKMSWHWALGATLSRRRLVLLSNVNNFFLSILSSTNGDILQDWNKFRPDYSDQEVRKVSFPPNVRLFWNINKKSIRHFDFSQYEGIKNFGANTL